MISDALLYPFRLMFSSYFNDDQLSSFLTGALTVGLVWLMTALHNSVPDKFTREWTFRNDDDCSDIDDDDDLSFVDPWNHPFTYVSTQQRRMVRSSISTMVDIQKHIGELPKRFKRKKWPWETIRRKVLGEESENEGDGHDLSSTNHKADDSMSAGTAEEEKKDDNFAAVPSGGALSDVHPTKNDHTNPTRTNSEVINHEGVSKKDEKQLCIGSIFGLDVGGTLAKLVYFEKKTPENRSLAIWNLREKQYVRSVSAQTVLMARMHDNNHAARKFIPNRSTSMSPKRKMQSPLTDEPNRVRSYTGDEIEYQYDEQIPSRKLVSSTGKASGRTLLRKTRHPDAYATIETKRNQTNPLEGESSAYQRDGENEEEKEPQSLPQHQSFNDSVAEDLKNLYAIRQESMPDDIHHFQQTVGFPPSSSIINDHHENEELIGQRTWTEDAGATPTISEDQKNHAPSNPPEICLSASTPAPIRQSKLRKRRSMSTLELSDEHERQKAEALNRFYDFARRLDSHEDSIRDIQLSFYCRELGGEFHFISFETRKIESAIDLIRFNNLHLNIRNMGATGGGAHKFAHMWERDLGIGMIKQDELNSLVAGMQFILSTVVGECFTFRPKEDRGADESSVPTEENETDSTTDTPQSDSKLDSDKNPPEKGKKIYKLDRWTRKVQRDTVSYSETFPYMLVTIGTGVSVLRVDGPRKHERVSGSTIGGGTFWGLMRLLTDVETFEEAMKLAEKGDPTKVDMMVGDIYGKDSNALDKLGLAADIVASSFGKLVSKEDPAKGLTQEDLARALLSLVTNNIGQVAYLNAKLHNTPRIYFVGSFLRHNMISQRRLSYAIDYWSKGEMEALFLEHEGYFGALGAFLMTQNIEKKDGGFFQWKDNP